MEGRQKGVVQEEAATFQYTAVEKLLGYEFKDKKLVEEALTHESLFYPLMPEVSYHRLEFMGDAVLSCLVAREVFKSYPALDPGHLTRLRAANVDKEKLARIAVNHHLHLYLRHKTTRLPEQIEDFMKAMHEYPTHSNGLLDPPKVLANIVESLLGAIFIDSNSSLDAVWKVFKKLAEPLISPETLGKHPMTELHELCQKLGKQVSIKKDGWAENGKVEVCIDGKLVGSATYVHKKEIAKNRAAKVALDWLHGGKADINLHTSPKD
ncbi:ribonuclease 3-like protein 3 [Typha latifolia]|uniref:ribonuclease 3-like protein 3 n=1 Tax=Typha latifolia TaxID=4733 RepID=UPI003C2EB20D